MTLQALVEQAKAGDKDSLMEIINRYARLIDSFCWVDGRYDEDCHSSIIERMIPAILRFKKA